MIELHEAWIPAASFNDLPPVPAFEEFEASYEDIDVGYDCFFSDAYVSGPYVIQYDEEYFGRDTWGWSAHIAYMDGNRLCYRMASHKKHSAMDAFNALCDYVDNL